MMKTLLAALVLVFAAPLRAAGLPADIAGQVPDGYDVMTYLAGQLNGDDLTDYLVVVHHPDDSRTHPSSRPLLIFIQEPGGTFRLAARNDHVVLHADDGFQCDPFDPGNDPDELLVIRHRYFTVQNAVACGQHWSYYITFHYDARRDDWLFHRLDGTMWNPKTMEEDPIEPVKADRRHPVTFAVWRPKNG
jgi:hypothetical protein